ncbi:MAG: TonB family protein [Deltaproteobacteria bacterium]|nr:TonB family protein [Deltaproteobacteria bacterium]
MVTSAQRKLRVAFVWNESIQDDLVRDEPAPVVLGGVGGDYPLPDDVSQSIGADALTILVPHGPGYALQVHPSMGGDVWIRGQRQPVSSLGASVPLGPDDYGVITIGPLAIFFQHVRAAVAPPRQTARMDLALVASVLLATLMCGSCLIFGFLDSKRRLERDPFELDEDLVSRFMVTPPPEDILEDTQESGTEMEDPGLRTRDDTGGKAHEGEEGRVGHEDSNRENTEVEGEVTDRIAAKVRQMGLLGALDGGGEGNAIAAALDVPTISDILGGTGATATRAGRGSRGAGLRGVGMGGGGTGPGSLFGAGDVGAGIGAGTGMGLGMGQGGIGAMGRERTEVQISVMRGTPQVNGYLSPEQINRVVRANQAAVRYCYQVEVQRQPNLRGRVEIAWRINLQGRVTTARVASSSLRNPRVEGCIVRQVRRWRFPQPDGGEVRVQYPFIFGLQGG